jgi:hypothetical protein
MITVTTTHRQPQKKGDFEFLWQETKCLEEISPDFLQLKHVSLQRACSTSYLIKELPGTKRILPSLTFTTHKNGPDMESAISNVYFRIFLT